MKNIKKSCQKYWSDQFGTNSPLVTLDQSCSNYFDFTWRPGGVANFSYVNIGKTLKIFLSETTRPRAMIFCIVLQLVDLFQVCSNYGLDAKTFCPKPLGSEPFTVSGP